MSTITQAAEVQRRESYTCNCTGVCGVNKTHQEIEQAFLSRFGDTPEHRAINRRWQALGRQAVAGRL